MEIISNEDQKGRKKACLKANQTAKKALKILENHTKYLSQMNMYDECKSKQDMAPNPSYSCMHSLDEGFSILMYAGSHQLKRWPDMCMYKYNAVRIILPELMDIIWHKSLFRAGARSRDTQDMRFFSRIWQYVLGSSINGTKWTVDGAAREIGDQDDRDNITYKICKDFNTENLECSNCRKVDETIDLRDIS